jgi:peptide/nickel transport system ATP-binding protein/oligopeptide transport system ATP-binding protein
MVVMYDGQIVEEGATESVFNAPQHPYTKALLSAHPARARSWRDLEPIPDEFVTDGPGGGSGSSVKGPVIVAG